MPDAQIENVRAVNREANTQPRLPFIYGTSYKAFVHEKKTRALKSSRLLDYGARD